MSSARDMVKATFLGLLPYPDGFRRGRIRRAAQELVRCDPWPGNHATPLQLTELCLHHALWLQTEVRRAALFRHSEAAALLARTSIETCLFGMYCLVTEDPMAEMLGATSEQLTWLMQYLVDLGLMPREVVDAAAEATGDRKVKTPGIFPMVQRLDEATENTIAMDLYRRLYVPLSSLFAHSNGLVITRHVGKEGKLQTKPSFPWLRRSATHVADVCVGILAWAIAEKSELPVQEFKAYIDAHNKRTITPVAAIGGRNAGASIRWNKVLESFVAFVDGANYVWNPESRSDDADTRRRKIRENLDHTFEALDPGEAAEAKGPMLDAFADHMAKFEPSEGETPPLQRLTRLLGYIRRIER